MQQLLQGQFVLIPFVILYTLIYSVYNHFGITELTINFIGNKIILGAVISGMVIGVKVVSVLMWLSCLNKIITSDKVIYIFGRLSPKLSFFLSIFLRMVPRIKEKTREINMVQIGQVLL